MKKIAVVLSGCGVYDGAEIHEAVLTMLAIAANGAVYEIFAPDMNQHHVVNHLFHCRSLRTTSLNIGIHLPMH